MCIASRMTRQSRGSAWMRIAANLVKDKYPPEPAKPGQVAREDYTYEKEGRANLFIAYEPLAGKRYLQVTEHRTKQDWALFMWEVLEEQYPDAAKVVVVMDNLNTHTPASFYEVFEPEQAKALADRLEIHYTPKHASWLNIAEIELSVLARQGLAHNIVSIEDLWKPRSELGRSSQPASRHGELAVPHGGCAYQTQATLSRAANRLSVSWTWSVTG
jgi:hypothetical protein